MRIPVLIYVIAFLGAFAALPITSGEDALKNGYVVAYKDEGFEGESIRFSIGEYKELKGDWDDEIESIELVGPVRVILFDDDDFEGDKLLLEHSAYELDDLDEEAESMIVEPFDCSSAAVFKKTKFRGKVRNFRAGEYPKLDDGWSSSIESVDLCGDVKITLFENENFEGHSFQIEQDQIDLDDFNGKAESMIVEARH
jgi:hypothetical protein